MSVGNLSVGGTGKTPLVATLARWLIARGERPAILSRGYRRQRPADGVVVVSDGTRILADVADAGDEPLMLARQVPAAVICVGADRYTSGALAERRLGCTVHLLDDGFQHVRLARDLDLLVTAKGEIPGGRVLPAGRLREPMAAAARADVVIVADATADEARAEAWTLGISQFATMARRLGAPRWVDGRGGPCPPAGALVAVAGIAHPDRFFTAARAAGLDVAETLPFPDHHPYAARDVRAINDAVHRTGAAAIVTTEKDAVRLEGHADLAAPLVVAPLEVTVEPWETVAAAIDAALARTGGAA